MLSFRQATKGELDFIIELAQNEFEKPNFAQMLPKLYADNANSEALHTFLYDDDALKGMFALQIKDFNIADVAVRVGWLGTVCVVKDARGKGYLAQLMDYANSLLLQNNCDICVLGGQRQRYKRFGYDFGGAHWIFNYNNRNLRDITADNISLQPIANHSKWLDLAYELYCGDCVKGARTKKDFTTVLSSWKSRPYAIVKDNAFTGYCSLAVDKAEAVVYELRLNDPKLTLNACKAILNECKKEGLEIYQCLWANCEVARLLGKECNSARLEENHSYKVFNWQKIILAGLRLKANCHCPMQAGTMLVQIQDSGTYKISVAQNEPVAVESCQTKEKVDLCLSQEQAILTLLGHTNGGQSEAPAGWLPLPLGFSWLDGI